MGILGFACKADAVTASPRSDICVIDTKCHLTVADVEQILGVGSCSIDVIDIAMGWIIKLLTGSVNKNRPRDCKQAYSVKVEHIEKIVG